jgi:hypothetical protein
MQAAYCSGFTELLQMFAHLASALEQRDKLIRVALFDGVLELGEGRAEQPQGFKNCFTIRQADISPHFG